MSKDCSRSKSQCWLIPDSSITFLSVSSPHLPLVFGLARRAFTSFPVSVRTSNWVLTTFCNSALTLPYAFCRSFSISVKFCLYSFSVSETGLRRCFIASSFFSFSELTSFWFSSNCALASSRNDVWFDFKASPASPFIRSSISPRRDVRTSICALCALERSFNAAFWANQNIATPTVQPKKNATKMNTSSIYSSKSKFVAN